MTRRTLWVLLAAGLAACGDDSVSTIDGAPVPDATLLDANPLAPDASPVDANPLAPDASPATPDAGPPCGDGLTSCDGLCVDTATDEAHCGSCPVACDPGQ